LSVFAVPGDECSPSKLIHVVQAICLAPSRELARQIQEVVDKIGQFTQIKTFLAVPGSWSRRVKITKHVLIGTPGTVIDMLSNKGGNVFDPKQIRVFVLDEADEMIALQGLGDQTSRIKRSVRYIELRSKLMRLQSIATTCAERAFLCYIHRRGPGVRGIIRSRSQQDLLEEGRGDGRSDQAALPRMRRRGCEVRCFVGPL